MFTLSQAIVAVANKPEFSVKERGDYVVIDYNVNNKETFVGKDSEESNILVNLRGTAFDKESGKIIRLGYVKFFNYGEFPEKDKTLSWDTPHTITQKLDGSLIFPIYTKSGTVLGTRAGVTDVSKLVDKWLGENPELKEMYDELIDVCKYENVTPLFEFCSRKNRIVLDYPETQLVLTGMRRITDGTMLSHDVLIYLGNLYGIPVVEKHEPITCSTFDSFHSKVTNFENDEGVVVLFDDGHMVKIKSSDYCLKHKAIDGLKFEKDLFLMALQGKLDDVVPLLSPEFARHVQAHSSAFLSHVFDCATQLEDTYWLFSNIEDQKEFALAVMGDKFQPFLFARRKNGTSSYGLILEHAIKQCTTQERCKQLKKFIGFYSEY